MHRRLIRVRVEDGDKKVFEATSPQPSALVSPMCGTVPHKTGSAIQKADLVHCAVRYRTVDFRDHIS
jgi:hypothetical protein